MKINDIPKPPKKPAKLLSKNTKDNIGIKAYFGSGTADNYVTGGSEIEWFDIRADNDFSEYPIVEYFRIKFKCYPNIVKDNSFIETQKIKEKIDFFCAKNGKIFYHYAEKQGHMLPSTVVIFKDKLVYAIESDYFDQLYTSQYKKGEYWKYTIRVFFTNDSNYNDALNSFYSFFGIEKQDYKDENASGKINILTQSQQGFELMQKSVRLPEIDFDLNYNEDIRPVNDVILKKIKTNDEKALILLHGLAGTGKTTYIRWLTHQTTKKVIFIPPAMCNSLSDPAFIKFLLSNHNSILIIEDAENALTKRDKQNSQSVSNLLNLTDGLLSDCANIQIICTFNTDIRNIDDALLRKGRLSCIYEFKQLDVERAKKLSEKLGKAIGASDTLANVYNSEPNNFNDDKSKIGFTK